jgi:hypothetical protein
MLFSKNKKMIDLNEYSQKELDANVDYAINRYHDNKNKNKIFKELSKIDSSLLKMRKAGLSLEYIRQFIIDDFNYKIGIGTLSEYYKVYHDEKLTIKHQV